MNPLLAAVIALIVYPGILFALVAALLLGWVRGTARALTAGWSGLMPPLSFRQISRRRRQASTLPEGAVAPVIQALPVIALVCPIVALAFVPLPGNAGLAKSDVTLDVVALSALLLGMPVARIALGLAIPSPYTRMAATRSARQLAGYALPLSMAVAAGAALSGHLTIAAISNQATTGTLSVGLSDAARVVAGITFLICAPALARLSSLREGQGASELAAGELTELSGRELLTMRLAEYVQLVAVIFVGIALFVLPFWTTNGARGLAAVIVALLAAAVIGAWEGYAPRLRGREDYPLPISIWLGTPSLIAIVSILALVLARIVH